MSLTDYLSLLRQRAGLVFAVVLLSTLAAVGLTFTSDPVHQASTRLRARPVAPGASTDQFFRDIAEQIDLGTEAELARSEEVAALVVERLGLHVPPSALLDQVKAGQLGSSAVLVIQAEADDPELAVALANAFADAYLTVRRADAVAALQDAAAALEQRFQELRTRLAEAEARLDAAPPGSFDAAEAAAERDSVLAELVLVRDRQRALTDHSALERGFGEVIQPAQSASSSRPRSLPRSIVFGLLLGVPLAVAAVLVLDSLSDSIRTSEDAEEATGAPVLGLIPLDPVQHRSERPRLAAEQDPYSVLAEAYRTASFNIGRAARDIGARTLLVTSAFDGDGKSTTAANLAVAQADRGENVVLVEADLRRPAAHRILGVPNGPGLADVLLRQLPPAEATVRLPRHNHLFFVSAGRSVLRPDRAVSQLHAALLNRLAAPAIAPARVGGSGRRPLLLVDGPPILQAGETSSLAATTDGVILVVRAGVTQRRAAALAAEQVRNADGTLLGVVLVGVAIPAELGVRSRDMRPGGRRARRYVGTIA